jgi:hypothetical protein
MKQQKQQPSKKSAAPALRVRSRVKAGYGLRLK